MTGESLRNPVPELAEGRPRAFVILANAGIHSLLTLPCHSVANASAQLALNLISCGINNNLLPIIIPFVV